MHPIFFLVHFLALTAAARRWSKSELYAKQAKAAERFQISPPLFAADLTSHVKNITFSNPKASGTFSRPPLYTERKVVKLKYVEFYVDGKSIPEVDWDVGPSWSGLLPISGSANETRKVGAMSKRKKIGSPFRLM
jgi:carboxypeptidase D